MFGNPYRNRNAYYYGNNQKVRSSCPVSFQTTSQKAQYQLRAGVFNFPKRSPTNNQRKNDYGQCTRKIREIQKDVQMKDKTLVRTNKRKVSPINQVEKRDPSSSTHETNDIPSKTKTEAKIDSGFTESSFHKNNKQRPILKAKENSYSSRYYSDYSYSSRYYSYTTNRENSNQNEYSESNYVKDNKQQQKQQPQPQQQSSITFSDHLSSPAIIERKIIKSNSEKDDDSEQINDISDDQINNESEVDVEHHESSDMQLSDMDSITIHADEIESNGSQKSQPIKNDQNPEDEDKNSHNEEIKENENENNIEKEKEIYNDYSNETEKISEIIISGDDTPEQDQLLSENNFQEEEALNEPSSENKNDYVQENKNRSVEINDNNNTDENGNNKNGNDEGDPKFKALLEANQRLVSAVLKNQETILNIVENEYTKKAMEHLHEAVTLLKSIEPE